MQFVYPGFLFALPVVLIPLIIHLFRFRRYRKVFFPNVRFIEELQLETEKRNRLKHILVLITRMLLLTMLTFAFAQPYIPHKQLDASRQSVRNISLYIDNSFSMEASAEDGALLETAKVKAVEIANAYGASDVFHLLTNDLEGRHHRYVSREDFMNMVLDVEPSPVSLSLDEVITRHKDLLGTEGKTGDLFVLSDFQISLIPEAVSWSDSGTNVFFIPLQALAINNVFIDSVWFDSPVQLAGMQSILNIRLRNAGSNDLEKLPIRLSLNGEQRAVATLDIPAAGMRETKMLLKPERPGWYAGELEIVDFPITYDDKYYLAFQVREEIPVLSIYDAMAGPFLNALFGNDSSMRFGQSQVLDLDYGFLASNNLIILNGLNKISSGLINVCTDFFKQGGSIAIFPGPMINYDDYNILLAGLGLGRIGEMDTTDTRVSDIDREHPLLRDVFDLEMKEEGGNRTDLPMVMAHYPLEVSALSAVSVMGSMQNGRPFVLASGSGPGHAYVFAVPLETQFSSLPRHAILVPLLYQMALHSRPLQYLSFEIGNDNMLMMSGITSVSEVVRLKNQLTGSELVPEIRKRAGDVSLFLHNQVRQADIYEVLSADDLLSVAAFNYNRSESDLRYFSSDELETLCRKNGWSATRVLDASHQDTIKMVENINKGMRFWKWFVLAALLLLAVEALLLRFMK